MERPKATTTDLMLMVAGAVMLVGSFLDFSGDSNAWDRVALPIVTLIPIYGLMMAVPILLSRLIGLRLPDLVFGFTWAQLNVVLSFFATLMSVAWLIASDDNGAGMWLMLVGSAIALDGALVSLIGTNGRRA